MKHHAELSEGTACYRWGCGEWPLVDHWHIYGHTNKYKCLYIDSVPLC